MSESINTNSSGVSSRWFQTHKPLDRENIKTIFKNFAFEPSLTIEDLGNQRNLDLFREKEELIAAWVVHLKKDVQERFTAGCLGSQDVLDIMLKMLSGFHCAEYKFSAREVKAMCDVVLRGVCFDYEEKLESLCRSNNYTLGDFRGGLTEKDAKFKFYFTPSFLRQIIYLRGQETQMNYVYPSLYKAFLLRLLKEEKITFWGNFVMFFVNLALLFKKPRVKGGDLWIFLTKLLMSFLAIFSVALMRIELAHFFILFLK